MLHLLAMAASLTAQVHRLEASHSYNDALVVLNDAIAKTPTAEAYALRCEVYVAQGHNASAVSDCEQALKLDPKSGPAYQSLGDAYYNDDDFKSALTNYDSAVEYKPDADTFWRRCDARRRLDDWSGAASDCEKAAQLAPGAPVILLSNARIAIHEKNYAKALTFLDTALATRPNDVNVLYWHGYSELQLERYQAAVDDFTKALGNGDTSADTYRDRYRAYLGLNKDDLAQQDWQKAIELYRAAGQCQTANDLTTLGLVEFKINNVKIEICKP